MNIARIFLACFTLFAPLALSGCAATGKPGPLPIRSLAKGGFSGIREAKREIISDRAAWEKVWALHRQTPRDTTPLPEVDFAKETAVIATMGTKRSGGYSIEITRAEVSGKKLLVSIQETSPPPGAMTIQAVTAPFHFVAIPRRDLPAEFVVNSAR